MPFLFVMVLEVLARAFRQEKEREKSKLKGRSKTVTICGRHDIIYRRL